MAKKLARPFSIFCISMILLAQFGLSPAAAAENFVVNSTADLVDVNPGDGVCETGMTGDCTLRAAIQEANALEGEDTITLPAGTYTLAIPGTGEDASATGDLDITGSLEIVGDGAGTTVIDAGDLDRVFHIASEASLTARGLTIRNGNLDAGAGVLVQGTFILENGVIADNAGSSGGGVFSTGSTTITESLIINNSAVPNDGGGLFAANGTLTLVNSTVASNSATGIGGGLVTTAQGGSPQVSINNVTFAGNSASNGGGIFFWSGTMSVGNTIVANSLGGGNCSGVQPISSLGNNLSSDGTCNFSASGDLLNTNPLLGPLADNGGPTQTLALLAGSPAIDAGNSETCAATDQRGVTRPQGDACDIGAFEFQGAQETNIFLVTNTSDSGAGSLRQAILDANGAPNSEEGPDKIHFDIPGAGVQTIAPASALPAITDPVILDGYTQPGASANTQTTGSDAVLRIQLSGTNAPGSTAFSLNSTADNSLLRGLVINDGFGIGIFVDGASGTIIQGNYIGTNPAGTAAAPIGTFALFGSTGIYLNNAPDTQIGGTDPSERNVIAGIDGDGIGLWNGQTTGTLIQGNYIGVGADGVTALPNGGTGGSFGVDGGGITLRNFTSGTQIGGTAAGAGNIIANNAPVGIFIYSGNNTMISGNTVRDNAESGVFLAGSGHSVEENVIADNGGSGVLVHTASSNNNIRRNSIFGNTGPDIDLGGDGVTFNHIGLIPGPNNYQNYPILSVAASDGNTLRVAGGLVSEAGQTYTIDIFENDTCHPTFFGGGQTYFGSFQVTTDGNGLAIFDEALNNGTVEPLGITATATGSHGTSEFSYCRPASTANLNWVQAQAVSSGSQTQQFITDIFQEKWFKIPVQPGSTIHVQLTSLPGSAVSLHRDPFPIYNALIDPQNAEVLSAEASDAAFLPSGSLPSGSLPSGSLPSGSLPSGSLPSGSLPTGYLPSGSLPSGSLPSGSLPSGSLPSGSLPSGSLPSGSLPSGSLPSGSLPSGSLPSGSLPSGSLPSGSLPSGSLPSGSLPSGSLDAYASAARRSLLGIAMDPYATVQTIERNTYDLQEDLYVRVVGPYNLETPFSLDVTVQGGVCGAVQTVPNALPVISGSPASGPFGTLILTDSSRLEGTATEIADALADLETLAQRTDVQGILIDLAGTQYPRVTFANTQADQNLACAFAKNTVAAEIKKVINAYRAASPGVEYIVLAGGAGVIPFFQVPDVSGLAFEKEYVVPVAPSTASEAGLQTNLVQGQDAYGSQVEVTLAGHTLALPDLAVGRLVDSASDLRAAVNAYIATDGVVTPSSALVTGYDFVGDAAVAIQAELEAGTSSTADTLIQAPGLPPTDPSAWTANQLRAKLFGGNFDIAVLTGHFSAGNLLAADYATELAALEVELTSSDLSDVLVLALGCHGGYTIPSGDLLPGISPEPDWAKAFLRKGAAGYISATGYAYGDTELTEYGERLFLLMAQQLRTDSGPISVGQAVVKAKQQYLAETAHLTGIDQKTLVEMTLYGLPMMKVDMPGARLNPPADGTIVGSTNPVAGGPGAGFGLSSAAVSLNPAVTTHTKQLQNLSNGTTVTTTYLSGADGVVANPFEPIYPKEIFNVTSSSNVLRGVAFRGGTYTDLTGIIPLTTSPTTETSTAHLSYNTDVFYPTQTWAANFTEAISGGRTQLVVFPAQFKSSAPAAIDGTLRKFNGLNLQLYYLSANWPAAGSPAAIKAAAVSAAPVIFGASGVEDGNTVHFSVNASADGSAGVQAVWVLYTGKPGTPYHGTWTPLDLTRNAGDPNLWEGSFQPTGNAADILFMVQAVGGAGLTTLATNLGAYYSVTPEGAEQLPPPAATTLELLSPPASGTYLKTSTFTLSLSTEGQPLAGQLVTLDIGGQQVSGLTNSSGTATLTLNLVVRPGAYTAQASFRGSPEYLGSNDTSPFTVNKDSTTLTVTPNSASVFVNQPTPFVAVVRDSAGRALGGKSVFFIVHNSSDSFVTSVIADFQGNASLGVVPLPPGNYTVDAYFNGTIPIPGTPLTLSDDYYESSSRSGLSLEIKNSFAFTGFFDPVKNPPVMNQMNAGRAVPIKFSLGGDQGLAIFATGFPQSSPLQCDTQIPSDSVEGTVNAGSSSLSYDPATGLYTYTWKTEKSWAGTCRQFSVQFIDGQTYTLYFRFVR